MVWLITAVPAPVCAKHLHFCFVTRAGSGAERGCAWGTSSLLCLLSALLLPWPRGILSLCGNSSFFLCWCFWRGWELCSRVKKGYLLLLTADFYTPRLPQQWIPISPSAINGSVHRISPGYGEIFFWNPLKTPGNLLGLEFLQPQMDVQNCDRFSFLSKCKICFPFCFVLENSSGAMKAKPGSFLGCRSG